VARFAVGSGYLFFSKMSRLALGFTQPPTQMVQRAGRNADLKPPFSSETNSQLHLHSRMCPYGADRDNFTFTFSTRLTRCDWRGAEIIERYGVVPNTPHRMRKTPDSNFETQTITTGFVFAQGSSAKFWNTAQNWTTVASCCTPGNSYFTHLITLCYLQTHKSKGKVHTCTGTEALYRPYGP
jgi:hypothetical protein